MRDPISHVTDWDSTMSFWYSEQIINDSLPIGISASDWDARFEGLLEDDQSSQVARVTAIFQQCCRNG
jgi:hypothetical protein